MKYKTTKKAVKEHYGKDIYYVHMSSPKILLGEPQAYITRVEGWACDVWEMDDIAITEGYSPMGRGVDFDLCKEYETKAREVMDWENKWPYKRKLAQIEKLKHEFIKKVKEGK